MPPRSKHRPLAGQAIKTLRKRLRLTQRKFARVLGIHAITVSRWERGEARPDGATLKLLRALDKHSGDLSKKRNWGKIVKQVGVAVAGAAAVVLVAFLVALFDSKGSKR